MLIGFFEMYHAEIQTINTKYNNWHDIKVTKTRFSQLIKRHSEKERNLHPGNTRNSGNSQPRKTDGKPSYRQFILLYM